MSVRWSKCVYVMECWLTKDNRWVLFKYAKRSGDICIMWLKLWFNHRSIHFEINLNKYLFYSRFNIFHILIIFSSIRPYKWKSMFAWCESPSEQKKGVNEWKGSCNSKSWGERSKGRESLWTIAWNSNSYKKMRSGISCI